MTEREEQLSTLRKRRGVSKGSVTRLHARVAELESDLSNPDTRDSAKRLLEKLEGHDKEYRNRHMAIVDLTEDNQLEAEQDKLDAHDDLVAALDRRIHKIITNSASAGSSTRKVSSKRLTHLQTVLSNISSRLISIPSGPEGAVMLQQFAEQMTDLGHQLSEVLSVLFSLDLDDSDDLMKCQGSIEANLFDLSLDVKKRLASPLTTSSSSSSSPDPRGVKLPRIDVPTFDGHLLQWHKFWEQFQLAVHDKTSLSNAEKLIYLQHFLKGESAEQTIEGLSSTGDHYDEAIKCLKERYNKPRLIHQAHVRMIIEAHSLKDGTGRELRRLHDNVQQHNYTCTPVSWL